MSDNYNETNVSGQSWNRCFKIEITNPYNGQQECKLFEEEIFSVGDKNVSTLTRILSPQIDMSSVINLINPMTGEPIGASITHQDLYIALFSLYINTAKAKDAGDAQFIPLDVPSVPPTPDENQGI